MEAYSIQLFHPVQGEFPTNVLGNYKRLRLRMINVMVKIVDKITKSRMTSTDNLFSANRFGFQVIQIVLSFPLFTFSLKILSDAVSSRAS